MAASSSNNINTALLVLDVQKGIMASSFPDRTSSYVSKFAALLDKVRIANTNTATTSSGPITIVHVNVAFRPGRPEIHPSSSIASRVKGLPANIFADGDESVALYDELLLVKNAPGAEAKGAGEHRVTKRRLSALSGTDLPTILRGRGISHLVLAGVVTSGAVLSTLREAADQDYRITVLKDLCMDKDEEVHRVLTEKVFPMHAKVLEVDEWVAGGFA